MEKQDSLGCELKVQSCVLLRLSLLPKDKESINKTTIISADLKRS